MSEELEELVRKELDCHNCGKLFVVEVDKKINGKYEITCPCGHVHYREIKEGEVTGIRWDSDNNTIKVKGRSVWQSDKIKAQTSTVAMFIRDRWLNRSDLNGY